MVCLNNLKNGAEQYLFIGDWTKSIIFPLRYLVAPLALYDRNIFKNTVKPVLNGHAKEDKRKDFQDWLSLNAGLKYCRMLRESILGAICNTLDLH